MNSEQFEKWCTENKISPHIRLLFEQGFMLKAIEEALWKYDRDLMSDIENKVWEMRRDWVAKRAKEEGVRWDDFTPNLE